MLRNKYFIAGLGVLLVLVVAYNISFFRDRRGSVGQAPGWSPGQTQDARPGHTASPARRAGGDYQATWRRDPFWYPGGRPRTVPTAVENRPRPAEGIRLEGTMNKAGMGLALISGRVYGVGDRVDRYEIVQISDRSVTLRGPEGTRTMTLSDGTDQEGATQ